jgi:hypothetical protein
MGLVLLSRLTSFPSAGDLKQKIRRSEGQEACLKALSPPSFDHRDSTGRRFAPHVGRRSRPARRIEDEAAELEEPFDLLIF